MSDSREQILQRIRQVKIPPTPVPELSFTPICYDDSVAQFVEMLELVGGQCVRLTTAEQLEGALNELEPWQSATRRCVRVPGVAGGNVDLDTIDDPHDLEDVEFALLQGGPAVAENGAVWLTDAQLPHRVLPFLSQHVGLVVEAGSVVDNMHAAYAVLQDPASGGTGSAVPQPGFGVWMSGPSKTADIEQSLVIGAHGARSLTVFLMGEPASEDAG